jgi:creatinine amidohydrolase
MRWDEMTPTAFLAAREAAKGLCVLPVASIERHGGHLPLGTDSFVGEEVCRRAARLEPMVVFPVLKFGVNGEAAANPGAVALRSDTLFMLLENLCDEIARNGFRKVLLFSSHGGNGHGLPFFVQEWATRPKDYMVYYYAVSYAQATLKNPQGKPPPPTGEHGGTYETAAVMAVESELVKMEQRLPEEHSRKQGRLKHLIDLGVYTAVNFYSDYPWHYRGPAADASPELGDEIVDDRARKLAAAARAIKADEEAPRLMREFRERQAKGGTLEPQEIHAGF